MNTTGNTVDWGYWLCLSSLTIREAACLLANVEPFEWNPNASDECQFYRKNVQITFASVGRSGTKSM